MSAEIFLNTGTSAAAVAMPAGGLEIETVERACQPMFAELAQASSIERRPQFEVKCLTTKEEWSLVLRAADTWTARALNLKQEHGDNACFQQLLIDCWSMCSVMQPILRTVQMNNQKEAYGCFDDQGQLQAIMVLSKNQRRKVCTIEALVSRPDNMPYPGNTDCVRGAGSELITRAKVMAREKGEDGQLKYKKLWAESLDSAVDFYARHQFQRMNPMTLDMAYDLSCEPAAP